MSCPIYPDTGSFDFRRTPWYKGVIDEHREYRTSILLFSCLVSAVFILVLAALHCAGIRQLDVVVAGLSFAGLALETFLIYRFKANRFLCHVAIVQLAVVLLVSFYTLNAFGGHILLMMVFPVIAIQLRGSLTGLLWSMAMYTGMGVGACLHYFGIAPWAITGEHLGISIGSSAVVLGLTYFSNRRNDRLVHRLTKNMLFNRLTGLPNREMLPYNIDPDCPHILAIIKIENFSEMSAHFGFDFADTITEFTAGKLKGGEHRWGFRTYQLKFNEFALLIRCNLVPAVADAVQLLCEISASIDFSSLPWDGDSVRLVYRIGATIINPLVSDDPRSALSRADIALKRAVSAQHQITIYTDDADERDSSWNYIKRFSELVRNKEEKSFRAVFQPIFHSDGLVVAWYEALLRIRHEDGSYSSIYPYLSIARATGFYSYLTDFMVRSATDMIMEYDVDVSVNISIKDIVRPEFVILIDEVYDRMRNRKGRIIFEILESDELIQLDKCLWFIEYIARYGFKIAIDDFGSGYSNYISLINLPVHIVKIDGTLIRKIHTDESARTLVEGIVHFCRKANKQTVAEFVEDEAVYASLSNLDIDFLQGYYLATPELPADLVFKESAETGC